MEFAGKIALVTGGASGIGRATALAFARAGATVVVSDISSDAGQNAVKEIVEAGGEAQFIHCDVSDRDSIKNLISKTVEAYGRLDCAYNNAGIGGPILPLADYEGNDWDKVIATNLTSIFFCMKYEITQMLRQGYGTIVNCASITGLVGWRKLPAYSASKHGIMGLTKTAALDYSAQGIRINAVCPGTIHTPIVDSIIASNPAEGAAFVAAIEAAKPIGRMGTVDEVASAVLWLSSPGASFMAGHGLVVDGGYVAQ